MAKTPTAETPKPDVVVIGKVPIPILEDQPENGDPSMDAPHEILPAAPAEEVRATRVPVLPQVKTDPAAPPPVLVPNAGTDRIEEDGTVLFISKVPGFQIRLGVDIKDLYTFSALNELRVTPEVAKRMKMHHLYEMGHFYLASNVLRSGDHQIVIKRDDPAAEARLAGKVLFYFPERASVNVMLPGVRAKDGSSSTVYVEFTDHRAAVEPELADVLRRHTFFREGRIRELT